MFDDISKDLATEYAEALSRLPLPQPVVRSLIAASANEHRYAEAHRKSSALQHARRHQHRAARLRRTASLAEVRSVELLAEVR